LFGPRRRVYQWDNTFTQDERSENTHTFTRERGERETVREKEQRERERMNKTKGSEREDGRERGE
jgi:hypothetical protein